MESKSFPVLPARRWEGKCAPIKRPKEIAYFSYDENHEYHCDDRSLSYYYTPTLPANLCEGFETFKKCEPGDEHLDSLLKTLIEYEKKEKKKIDVQVVTWRGMMTKLLSAPYDDRDGFEMNATLYQGTIYIEENYPYRTAQQEEQARQQARRPPRPGQHSSDMMTYWGYKFEALSTLPTPFPDTSRDYITTRHKNTVSNAPQYCSLALTGLSTTTLLLGGEIDALWDCRPPPGDPRINWVELKTSLDPSTPRDWANFTKKTMKFWLQSFLLGVPKIVVGFRDHRGTLKRVQELETSKLPGIAKGREGGWDGNVCVNFGAGVLEWLREVVDDEGVYRIARRPGGEVQVTKIEEVGHGRILTDEFLNHRIKLAMGGYERAPSPEEVGEEAGGVRLSVAV